MMNDLYKPKHHEVRAKQFEEDTKESAEELAKWINEFGTEYEAKYIPKRNTRLGTDYISVSFWQVNDYVSAFPGTWVVFDLGEFQILTNSEFHANYEAVQEKEHV